MYTKFNITLILLVMLIVTFGIYSKYIYNLAVEKAEIILNKNKNV